MPDPTTTSTAAAWAVSAGLIGAFFAAVGVSWDHVFWAAAGAYFGAGVAPAAGRIRAIAMFPVSTMLAAKIGVIGAAWLSPVGAIAANELAQGIGGLAGLLFHPLATTLIKIAPELARRRFGMQSEDKP